MPRPRPRRRPAGRARGLDAGAPSGSPGGHAGGNPRGHHSVRCDPATGPRRDGSVAAAGLVGAGAVRLRVEDVEAAIEVHVDLAPVRSSDLDLVIALLVANLGCADLTAAGLLQGGRLRPVERTSRDRL